MTPPADKPHIDALAELLDARGLNADDFIQIVDILGALKKKELDSITREEEKSTQDRKIFVDKEFVFETRDDCIIYRDGRTKTGNYYVRIYDAETKKVFSKSLRTRHRVNALVAAEAMVANNERINGEFYVAPVYNKLIKSGKKIVVYNVGSEGAGMFGLGTPSDLELYLTRGH